MTAGLLCFAYPQKWKVFDYAWQNNQCCQLIKESVESGLKKDLKKKIIFMEQNVFRVAQTR